MSTFVRPSIGTGARTLDGRWYTSPDVFADERERIFTRDWICVGRTEELTTVGDYRLADVAGESVIVVRDQQGTLHAFYNVCRHRGSRVCEQERGHFAGSIQCPYHAWTYALDGSLKVARNMADVPSFDVRDFPLHRVALATWEGFIFLNLTRSPEPFEVAFAPLLKHFAEWNVASLRTARSIEYHLECNWKLVFQNYSECYHCPPVHPQLDRLSPSDSGRNDLTDGRFLGGYSELRDHASSLTSTGDTNRPPLRGIRSDNLNRVYYYTIFPSMLFSLHPDYVMVHYVRPLAVDRTHVVCSWLFDHETMSRSDFDPSDAVDFWDLTNRQDWHVNELTQKGVESRAYVPGPYANAEGLLAAFDRHYLRVMEPRD
jgi:Rieske 2Fe-2S family protein